MTTNRLTGRFRPKLRLMVKIFMRPVDGSISINRQIVLDNNARQLRRETRAQILAALSGEEPLYGDWLSEETLVAAARVLAGSK